MEMQRTKNTLDGRLATFSSHHDAQDVPDGRGFLSLGFWGDSLWGRACLGPSQRQRWRAGGELGPTALEQQEEGCFLASLFAESAKVKTNSLGPYREANCIRHTEIRGFKM